MSLCKGCIFDCGVKNIEKCNGFIHKVTEKERLDILEQIREQNMSIPVFCGDNHLKSQYVKKMIHGKMEFTYKIYTLLMDRLLETEEWTYEERRFNEGSAV
jgi:hypothetical protein